MSKRTDIKKKIEEVLIAAGLAGGRVFPNRTTAHFNTTFPMIEIYSLKGSNKRESSSRVQLYERTLDVVIKIVDESKSETDFDLSESLDNLSESVEKELLKDPYLGGLSLDIEIGDFEESFENLRVLTAAQGTIFKIRYEEEL